MDFWEYLHCSVQVAVPYSVHRHEGEPCYLLPLPAVSLGEIASDLSLSDGDARSSPGLAGFRGLSNPAGVGSPADMP